MTHDTDPPRLTLFGRTYCHLCQDMEIALEPYQREFGFFLDTIDLDQHPELEERFGELVPVLMAGELEICHYHLDDRALRAFLRKVA